MHARRYESGRPASRERTTACTPYPGGFEKDGNGVDCKCTDACIYHRLSTCTSIHKICGVCLTNIRTSYDLSCMYVYTHIILFNSIYIYSKLYTRTIHISSITWSCCHSFCRVPHSAQASHISGTILFPFHKKLKVLFLIIVLEFGSLLMSWLRARAHTHTQNPQETMPY